VDNRLESFSDVRGVAEAIALYGEPVRRSYRYRVREDRWGYWESARRKRGGEVVLLLRRPNGQYVVHTKSFYPQGVYRLLSGGIKPGEDLVSAVLREAHEETGLCVDVLCFLALAEHHFLWGSRGLGLTSYLFVVSDRGGILASGDPDESITDFREVSLGDLQGIATDLESLPPGWSDWGQFRSSMHRLAVELLSGDQDER
jgi:8-oxo-dGTP pyrophosphatase MutT (NUDIX family)